MLQCLDRPRGFAHAFSHFVDAELIAESKDDDRLLLSAQLRNRRGDEPALLRCLSLLLWRRQITGQINALFDIDMIAVSLFAVMICQQIRSDPVGPR
mgnify:CR=1 FL=1